MDRNSSLPSTPLLPAAAQGDPYAVDPHKEDWRSIFRPEARQITVNRIMEAMKKHFSGYESYDLSESDYKKIAVQLEENIYSVAVDQNDYTHRIIMKVLSFETKSQSTSATNPSPSNPSVADLNPADPASIGMQTHAGNHGKPLSMPLVSQSLLLQSHLSQNLKNSSLSAALPSVNNAQKQVQGRQQQPLIMSQHPTSQNQIMHQHQLLKQTARHSLLQQNQLQSSHQNFIEQSIPYLVEQQISMPNIQQNQLHGQQNNVLERQLQQQQRLPGQQDSLMNMQHSQQMSNQQAKLKALKELYYPELNEIYQKISTKLQVFESLPVPHAKQSEQVDKLRSFKKMLERYIVMLQTSKNNIPEIMRVGFANFEKQLLNLINSTRISKAPSATATATGMQSAASSSLKPGSMPLLTHMTNQTSVGSLQSISTITASQHTSNNNGPQGSMNTSQSIAGSLQHQLSKQQHEQQQIISHQRQMQQLMQQSVHIPMHDKKQLHQMNDMNESKGRQISSTKSGVHQQQYPSGQRHNYYHQQQNLQVSTPQISQQPSPQFEQECLLASQSKVGTPLQPVNTLFVPSPSTPIAPSPIPPESEKLSVHASPHNTVNVGPQQTPQAQFLAVGTPGISTSPLLAELTSPDGSQGNFSNTLSGKLSTTEEPIDRLVKAVQSLTPKALMSSISHMRYIVSMVDNIAGSAPGNRCRTAVSEDLVATTKCRLQARDSISQEGSAPAKKLKRHIESITTSSVERSGAKTSDVESITTSSVERSGAKASPALMEEIKEINQRLIDTVVSISEDPNGGGEGTVIKFSFNAVSLSPSLKSQLPSALMSQIMPLRLLVPTNYPTCSPLLLDEMPVEASNEFEDLSVKAQSRFNIALRCHAQPMSLGEMARTWDVCIRGAIDEDAQQSGGGSFSLRYGAWQSCV